MDENSAWDWDLLDWHVVYHSTFNDPSVRAKAKEHYEKFRKKGNFAAVYELANEPESSTE